MIGGNPLPDSLPALPLPDPRPQRITVPSQPDNPGHLRALVDILFETGPAGRIMLDGSGQILACNTSCARQFGYKPDGPPLGETFDTLVPDAATGQRHNSLGPYLAAGIGIDRDASGRRKDGSLFPIRLTLGAIPDGGAAAFIAVIHDLSEQHRAQDRQRDREAQFRRLFDSSPIGAVLATADKYRFVQVNPAFCHMLGYAPDELVGRTRREILHPDDPPAEPSDSLGLTATQRFITKSGQVVIGRVGAWRISGEADGQPVVLGLTEDVTTRQQMEAQLRQVQRMEAVGQLTGGIAHDFNNLLGVIIGNIEFLNDALHDKPAELELGEEILHSAISGAELTRRLLAFARQQKLQPKLVDLNAYLPPQIALLQRTLGDAITISATLAPDLWPTVADLSQIGDALLNLAINARDAMPEGGRLTIETANAHLDADPTAPHGAGQTGEPSPHASSVGASPGGDSSGRLPGRGLGRAVGLRHRQRHVARGDCARHGAVLHHQASGCRHRPGPVDDLRFCPAIRRQSEDRKHAWHRHHGPPLSAAVVRRGGARVGTGGRGGGIAAGQRNDPGGR